MQIEVISGVAYERGTLVLLRGPNLLDANLKIIFAPKGIVLPTEAEIILRIRPLCYQTPKDKRSQERVVLPGAHLGFSILSNSGLGILGFIPNKAFQLFCRQKGMG